MIVLMGVAGVGKSTQGRMLADQKGYAWISTGEILRVLVTGSRRHEMLQGKLLTDDEMIKVLSKVFELIDPNDEFVLDGFPRTVVQTDWLIDQAEHHGFSRIIVLNLYSDRKVVHDRLAERGRADDTEAAIAKRFEEYEKVTMPLVKSFKEHGIKIYEINGDQDPETVHKEIMRVISEDEE